MLVIEEEVAYTEYHEKLPLKRDLEFFRDKLPVMFFSGKPEDLFMVKCDLPDRIRIIESSILAAGRLVDREKLTKKILSYVADFRADNKSVLLVDKITHDVVYDFNYKMIVDYTFFDDLPPEKRISQVVCYWPEGNDEESILMEVEGGYGFDSALYIMYYSKQLLTGKESQLGPEIISKLFTDYYSLEAMNNYQIAVSIKPTREKSRFSEDQLKMLDGFCVEYESKKASVKKAAETLQKSVEQIGAEDEITFQGKPVSLSWIRDNHRIPLLKTQRFVKDDIGFCTNEIETMHIYNGRLFYRCKVGKHINPTFVKTFLQLMACDVAEIAPMNQQRNWGNGSIL